VLEVDVICCTPVFVPGDERVLCADDFAFEECGQGRMVLGEACL
jgi:hypothetical protein